MGGQMRGKGGKQKKYAGRNNNPSRVRYWTFGTLQKHKIRNMMQSCGLSFNQANAQWISSRKTRMK